jgi:glycosyltransferase involved in cell wall biosynthesis
VIAHFLLPSAFPWALFFGSVSNGLEVVIHGSDLVLFQALPRMAQALILRRILRLKGRLRFVSEEQKRQLLAKSWPEPIREMIVRAAVRPSPIFVSTPPPRDEARLQLGLGPSCRIALWVGRLISSKRPEAAISAAELVPGLELYVIGDGPLRGTLQERHPWAHFLGRRSRKETLLWMRAADLLLATSQLEGAPTAIREARMLGTTVVSVACGDVAAWAKNDPELWITSPLNASSMDV